MKLFEIIEVNQNPEKEILISEIHKYKKSLLVYYRNEWGQRYTPLLLVTSVFNACQYGKIIHPCEAEEAANDYLNADKSLSEDEKEEAKETIFFNSISLEQL